MGRSRGCSKDGGQCRAPLKCATTALRLLSKHQSYIHEEEEGICGTSESRRTSYATPELTSGRLSSVPEGSVPRETFPEETVQRAQRSSPLFSKPFLVFLDPHIQNMGTFWIQFGSKMETENSCSHLGGLPTFPRRLNPYLDPLMCYSPGFPPGPPGAAIICCPGWRKRSGASAPCWTIMPWKCPAALGCLYMRV